MVTSERRKLYAITTALFGCPFYCLAKAISAGFYFKAFLWLIPTLPTFVMQMRATTIHSMLISKIYLKPCGTKLVISSVLGLWRTLDIEEIRRTHLSEQMLREIVRVSDSLYPLECDNHTLFFSADAKILIDKQTFKAIINGHCIDTSA